MPIHDWSRVDAGVFHGFHVRWIARLTETLTAMLPPDYYADAEQHADTRIADVLTLRIGNRPTVPPPPTGTVAAVQDVPVNVAVHRASDRKPRQRRRSRHIVVRHVTGHQIVAMIEIVSPGNKDRRRHAANFVAKGEFAIGEGIHLAVIDLFPPTPSAPVGLACGVWQRFEREPIPLPPAQPLSFGSFAAYPRPEAFFEFRAIGEEMPSLPLFIADDYYLKLPLAETYTATFETSAAYLRDLLAAQ
jgi:hypothetical protein